MRITAAFTALALLPHPFGPTPMPYRQMWHMARALPIWSTNFPKDKLTSCVGQTPSRTVFSIGHRGAPLMFPEHSDELKVAAARIGDGWYFQSVNDIINNNSYHLAALDALAHYAGVEGVFSDCAPPQ